MLLLQPTVPLLTSLPAAPVDGQVILFQADATNGVVWQLRYRTGQTYPWEFIGGSPLVRKVDTDETFTADATMHDCTTVGPDVALPFNGDYTYHARAEMYTTAGGAQIGSGIGVAGISLPAAPDWCFFNVVGSSLPLDTTFHGRVTGQVAGRALRMQYQCSAATAHARYRVLFVTPVRVS